MTVIKLFNIFCSIEVENIVADIRDLGWGGDGQYYDLVRGIRWVSVLLYRGSDHRQQEGKASN